MGDYDALDKFTLKDHGDRWEREWWHLVEADFPSYETFWRRYIVPLTKRISGGSEQEWLQLRPGISNRLEQMAMSHYSVFYFMARATLRIRSAEKPFPEDIFALLHACADNLLQFFSKIREVLTDWGREMELPTQTRNLGPFAEVQSYRDTLLHNPVLVRLLDRGVMKLPRQQHLKALRRSWGAIKTLQPTDFVEETDLYNRLLNESCQYLEGQWVPITEMFDSVRETDKFKKQWMLAGLFPIKAPSEKKGLIVSSSGMVASSATAVSAVISNPKSG